MDLQTQANQQLELRNLNAKNEELLKRRADSILKKLEALNSQTGEVYLLDNVHLSAAIQYINENALKKQRALAYSDYQQQIDEELESEVTKQNEYLVSQVDRLKQEIQKLKTIKQQYIKNQQITSKQILQLDQIIAYNILNSNNKIPSSTGQTLINTTLHFAYETLANGDIRFNKSYTDLLQHNFKRIKQDQAIIQRLQNVYKENIKKTQSTRFKIQKMKQINQQLQETKTKVQSLQEKNNHLKQLLSKQARKAENQIEERLAFQIDNNNWEISNKKRAYQKAYFSILEIMKRVIDHANLETVTDYIQKS